MFVYSAARQIITSVAYGLPVCDAQHEVGENLPSTLINYISFCIF